MCIKSLQNNKENGCSNLYSIWSTWTPKIMQLNLVCIWHRFMHSYSCNRDSSIVIHLLFQHPVSPPLEVYIIFPMGIVTVKHVNTSRLQLWIINLFVIYCWQLTKWITVTGDKYSQNGLLSAFRGLPWQSFDHFSSANYGHPSWSTSILSDQIKKVNHLGKPRIMLASKIKLHIMLILVWLSINFMSNIIEGICVTDTIRY
jgi:hypothetical protein